MSRTVTVSLGDVKVNRAWRDSSIAIIDGEKKAVIEIRDPWDLNYLRIRLDEIEQYWKTSLENNSRG